MTFESIDFRMRLSALSVIVVPCFCHSAASKVNAQSSAPGPPAPLAAPRHYPGGWQPPGTAAPALPAAPEAARKAEALGHEMWELQRLRMPLGEDLMGF